MIRSLHSIRDPPTELAQVELSARTKLPGGVVLGMFLVIVAAVALPLFLLLLKPPPGPPKTTDTLVRVDSCTRASSGGGL